MRAITKRGGLGIVAVAAGLAGCRAADVGDLFASIPSPTARGVSGAWVRTSGACATAYRASDAGHVVYASMTDRHIHRVEARPGAFAEDVSFELDELGSGGTDGFVNLAPGGEWMVIGTSRFGCGDDACLALVAADVCSAQVILDPSGGPINADGTAAIGVEPGGDVVVIYPDLGPHPRDLFAIRKHGDAWGAPVLLTSSSPHAYNQQPAIADDATKVLFDCGDDPEAGGAGTALCEAAIDGSSVRVVMTPSDGPPGRGARPLHSGDYAPAGALVFEGQWSDGDEQVWHRSPGAVTALVNDETDAEGKFRYSDDNSPCVLPDGRIASLWLGRDGSQGNHEVKVMNADGTGAAMLVIGENTLDVGIGCGR